MSKGVPIREAIFRAGRYLSFLVRVLLQDAGNQARYGLPAHGLQLQVCHQGLTVVLVLILVGVVVWL